MADRFRYDPSCEQLLARGSGMEKFLAAASQKMAQDVREQAPRGFGGYRNQIEAETVMTREGWVGRVTARSSFWHLVEFGSIKSPARASLRRALERVVGARNIARR